VRLKKSRGNCNSKLKFCKKSKGLRFGLFLKGRDWRYKKGNCNSKLKFCEKSRGWRFGLFLKGKDWRYRRKMRILNWLWNLFLVVGVYSIKKPIIIPMLEDIENKLRASAGPGNYGLGQKVSTEQFGEFWNPSRRGTLLVEMGFVLLSRSVTNIKGIEVVANRNLETAKTLYAGKIKCRPTQYSCLSRRKVAMYKFRSTLDAFANLQNTTQVFASWRDQLFL